MKSKGDVCIKQSDLDQVGLPDITSPVFKPGFKRDMKTPGNNKGLNNELLLAPKKKLDGKTPRNNQGLNNKLLLAPKINYESYLKPDMKCPRNTQEIFKFDIKTPKNNQDLLELGWRNQDLLKVDMVTSRNNQDLNNEQNLKST